MFKKTKGFTIIEIILVLAIAGILFAVTVNISRDQIGGVQSKQQKSEFVDNYNNIYQNNLRTKRYSGHIYSGMQIKIQSGSNALDIEYYPIFKDKNNENKTFKISKKLKDGQFGGFSGHSDLILDFKPLSAQCQLSFLEGTNKKTSNSPVFRTGRPDDIIQKEHGSQEKEFFSINYPNKKYCFSLQTPLCQLQEISCEGLGSK